MLIAMGPRRSRVGLQGSPVSVVEQDSGSAICRWRSLHDYSDQAGGQARERKRVHGGIAAGVEIGIGMDQLTELQDRGYSSHSC